MEDVRPILVHVDAVDVLAMHIAASMAAPVYHQATLSTGFGLVGKYRTIESGAHYEKIVGIFHWYAVFIDSFP